MSRDGTVAVRQEDVTPAAARAVPNPFNAAGYNVVREQAERAAAQKTPDQTAGKQQEPDTRTPIEVLHDKLAELGISTASLTFTEEVQMNTYPTGLSWENHWITVDYGAFREHYDVEWMLRNPQVTAVEIQSAMKLVS